MKFTEDLDLSYVEGSGHDKHKLDVYAPSERDEDEPRPLVVFVHGGGWKRGDRRWQSRLGRSLGLYENVGQALASRGVVCAVISYRLTALGWWNATKLGAFVGTLLSLLLFLIAFLTSIHLSLLGMVGGMAALVVVSSLMARFLFSLEGEEEVKVGDQVEDLVRALEFIRGKAGTYGASGEKMVLMGHSAGAHLSLLTTLSQDLEPSSAETVSHLRGVIGVSGVYNLGRLRKNPILQWFYVSSLLSDGAGKEEERAMSPLTHATPSREGEENERKIQVLLLSAKYDFHLPRDARDLHSALSQEGVCEHIHLDSKTHQTIISSMRPVEEGKEDIVSDHVMKFVLRVTS